jgi:hypothetical protein
MATVPVNPYSLKNATLAIADDDYTAAVTQIELTPNTSASSIRTIDGVVHRDQATAEWTANIGFFQDLTANSLLRYLFDHEGEKKLATFTPVTAGPVITATLIISPSTVGGATSANGSLIATVALAVDGKPAFDDTP